MEQFSHRLIRSALLLQAEAHQRNDLFARNVALLVAGVDVDPEVLASFRQVLNQAWTSFESLRRGRNTSMDTFLIVSPAVAEK